MTSARTGRQRHPLGPGSGGNLLGGVDVLPEPEHEVVALPGQVAHGRGTDPAAAARDHGERSGHHHSESSLLSIARRCFLEHSSQNQRWRPFSTAETHVIGGVSDSTTVPQKEQVTTGPR